MVTTRSSKKRAAATSPERRTVRPRPAPSSSSATLASSSAPPSSSAAPPSSSAAPPPSSPPFLPSHHPSSTPPAASTAASPASNTPASPTSPTSSTSFYPPSPTSSEYSFFSNPDDPHTVFRVWRELSGTNPARDLLGAYRTRRAANAALYQHVDDDNEYDMWGRPGLLDITFDRDSKGFVRAEAFPRDEGPVRTYAQLDYTIDAYNPLVEEGEESVWVVVREGVVRAVCKHQVAAEKVAEAEGGEVVEKVLRG